MENLHCTFICFDYGGYYMKDGAEMKWVSGDSEGEDEIHTIVLKKSVEEVTYFCLVERILIKIKVDEYKMEARISYFPMVLNLNKPSYIWNDEDVFGYLLQVNHEKCRSVLHVEFSNDIYKTNEEVQLLEDDDETDVYAGLSDREATDRDVTDREAIDREASDTEAGVEYGIDGVLTFYEDTEVRPSVEVTHVVYQTRDDGMDLVLGQEFRAKEEAQVHIETASHQKCFEYEIVKSDISRYVIKCRGAKDGCKWFVRVAKLVNSDHWTVRSYIKQHTCFVVTTRTLPNKRRGTPQIVAAMLAQDYPGSFDTPVPNTLIDLIHHRIGVHVSYPTAWTPTAQNPCTHPDSCLHSP
ncbi:hypothetical protein N665_1389s0001 [Sinapis alba]|nr:hypothetical protein N665_1389s0001 [Sinapis alba]